jgi:hypothetical protein
MTVYVDDMRMQAKVGRITARWSHLQADSDEELHAFAEKLGLKRSWAQKPGTVLSHYDVTDNVRAMAIRLGAVPIGYMSQESRDLMRRKIADRDAANRVEKISRADAYLQGICVDCQAKPHSAGRPRCNDCHDGYVDRGMQA